MRFIAPYILFTFINLSLADVVYAQEKKLENRLGVGGQAGVPTGLTLKYYFNHNLNIIVVNTWSLERFLLLSSYVSYESPIPDSPLGFYLGPGAFVGRDDSSKDEDFKSGFGLVLGLNFFVEKFEVFLQGNPDLAIRPDIEIKLGGAVGIRYFF